MEQSKLSHPVRLWRAITITALLLASAAFFFAARNYNGYATQTEQIRAAQLANCQQVGNPIILAVTALIKQQIESSAHIDPAFFPNVPRAQLLTLIHEQQAQRRTILRQLQRIPTCVARYGG